MPTTAASGGIVAKLTDSAGYSYSQPATQTSLFGAVIYLRTWDAPSCALIHFLRCTGAHKERFDADGRGLEGRTDADTSD